MTQGRNEGSAMRAIGESLDYRCAASEPKSPRSLGDGGGLVSDIAPYERRSPQSTEMGTTW